MTIKLSCKASIVTLIDPKKFWEKFRSIFHTLSEPMVDAKLTRLHKIIMENGNTILTNSNIIESTVNELSAIVYCVTEI